MSSENKASLKTAALVLLFWSASVGAGFLACNIQAMNKTDTGRDYPAGFFNGTVYRYETGHYVAGTVLFLAVMFVLWWFIHRGAYQGIAESTTPWKIVCGVITAVGAFGMFIALVFALFMNVGMADTLEPGILMAVTAAGWPLVTLGLCIGGLVWYVRKEG